MALGRANAFSRFVMCGGISQYNAESKSGPTVSSPRDAILHWCQDIWLISESQKNFFNVIGQRIK
jgi:hypothetical protein